MSDTPNFKAEPLDVTSHNDPDRHWIGESLAPPTQSEIAATVGSTASPGESPFVARADHTHKVDLALLPVPGMISAYIGTTAPGGWLLLNGATIVGGQTTYPGLWAVIPAGWKSGANIVLPNMANRVPVGNNGTLGGIAGAMTHTLAIANMPSHSHTINHDHAQFNTGAGTAHGHTYPVRDGAFVGNNGGNPASADVTTGVAETRSTNTEAAHTHPVNIPAFTGTSGLAGSGSAIDHTPAHLEVNFIIKT